MTLVAQFLLRYVSEMIHVNSKVNKSENLAVCCGVDNPLQLMIVDDRRAIVSSIIKFAYYISFTLSFRSVLLV